MTVNDRVVGFLSLFAIGKVFPLSPHLPSKNILCRGFLRRESPTEKPKTEWWQFSFVYPTPVLFQNKIGSGLPGEFHPNRFLVFWFFRFLEEMLRRAFHSWSQSIESYVAGNHKRIEITVPLSYLPSSDYQIQSCFFDAQTKRIQITATAVGETLAKKKESIEQKCQPLNLPTTHTSIQ